MQGLSEFARVSFANSVELDCTLQGDTVPLTPPPYRDQGAVIPLYKSFWGCGTFFQKGPTSYPLPPHGGIIMIDVLTAARVRQYLPAGTPVTELTVLDSIDSTNTALKAAAAGGAAHGTVLIAAAQTAGRGRRGRSFFSPGGTGLYVSLLLRPDLAPDKAIRLTTAAAVAAAGAIEAVTGADVQIKWVNDLFLAGRKIAGILTESAVAPGGDLLDYAVLGIGINITPPEGGFPGEIAEIAGALLQTPVPDGRARIAAAFLTRFFQLYESVGTDTAFMDEYRRRSFVPGRDVTVLRGEQSYPAHAVAVNDDGTLTVRLPDGTEQILSSGEISVRV